MSRLHQTLVAHRFYPLVAASALAALLLLGRVALSGNRVTLVFLGWNLVLAWVPWVCSTWAATTQRRWVMWAAGAVWLVFLPNAPYVVTDFLHLRPRSPIPLWYDTALIASFAWAGCLLALVSLRTMHGLVARRWGGRVGWVFVAAAAGLAGVGIYIGRFLRWNSWDLAVRPGAVVGDLLEHAVSPGMHWRAVGVAAAYAGLFLATYLVFAGSPRPGSAARS